MIVNRHIVFYFQTILLYIFLLIFNPIVFLLSCFLFIHFIIIFDTINKLLVYLFSKKHYNKIYGIEPIFLLSEFRIPPLRIRCNVRNIKEHRCYNWAKKDSYRCHVHSVDRDVWSSN